MNTGLKALDPVERYKILYTLLHTQTQDTELCWDLCCIITGDEVYRNRNAAVCILSRLLNKEIDNQLLKYCLSSLSTLFFDVFPETPHSKLDRTQPDILQSRIAILDCCLTVLDLFVYIQEFKVFGYIDRLIKELFRVTTFSIMNVSVSTGLPILHYTIVKTLSKLPKTNRFREWINSFRPLIMGYQCENRLWKIVLDQFSNSWWRKLTDEELCFVVDQDTKTEGMYLRKRKEYLQQFDTSDTIFDDLEPFKKLELVKKAKVDPFFGSGVQTRLMTPKDSRLATPNDRAREPIRVLKKGSLKVNLPLAILEFHTTPQTLKLRLDNTTPDPQEFTIQLSHPELFMTSPGGGVIEGQSSMTILVTCRPCLTLPSGRTQGYMYIRSKEGLPLDRLTLTMTNLPVISTPSKLYFDHVPNLKTRVAHLEIQNLVGVELKVVMVVKRSHTSFTFQVPGVVSIAPQDTKLIAVKATPDFSQLDVVRDTLYVVAMGQVCKVEMEVIVSPQLEIETTAIQFGFTDIFFNSVKKKLCLVSKRPTPVTFSSSTNEVKIKDIVVKGETIVPIEFESAISGTRTETLTICAPNTHPTTIKLTAFSGPYVKLPLFEDLYMPAAMMGETTYLRFPVGNLYHESTHVSISTPIGMPVKLQALAFDYTNHGKGDIQAKSTSTSKSDIFKFVLPPLATIMIEVGWTGLKAGIFKVPMYTAITKPCKIDIATHYLYIATISENYLTELLRSSEEIHKWSRRPYLVPVTDAVVFNEKDTPDVKVPGSSVFQLDPPTKLILGPLSSNEHDTIHLVNVSNDPQRYRIILSYHFVTNIPLEGELPPNSVMDIPVFIDPKINFSPESFQFTVMGSVTILDYHFSDPGIVTCQLVGCIGDPICFEVRQPFKDIQFPETLPMEQSSRKFLIRNKNSNLVTVEIKCENSGASDYNPFMCTSKQVQLKPFALTSLEIAFKPLGYGEYRAKFSLVYVDPNIDATQKSKRLKTVGPIYVYGVVSPHEVQQEPDVLLFGDVDVDELVTNEIMLTNPHIGKESVLISTNCTIAANPSQFVMESKSSTIVEFGIHPSRLGHMQQIVAFDVGGKTHTVDVIATIARICLESNIAQPLLMNHTLATTYDPPQNATIEIGQVCIGDEKFQVLEVRNSGTVDVMLSKPEFGDSCVTFEPIYLHFYGTVSDANRISFGTENLDQKEMDWDNFAFLQESKPFMNAYFKSKQSHIHTRRIGSIFDGNSKLNALFPSNVLTKDTSPKYGGFAIDRLFPYRLSPHRTVKVQLRYSADNLGSFCIPIRFKSNYSSPNPKEYIMWLKGCVLRPLILNSKAFDLGTCPINIAQKTFVKFTNEESVAIPWKIEYNITKIVPMEKFDYRYQKYLSHPRCPVVMFPKSGILGPGATQTVEVSFTPSVPQAETMTILNLLSGDYNKQEILISATGGSAIMHVSHKSIDFGTLRVGMKKSIPIRITNPGILSFKFHIESTDPDVVVEPELGKVGRESKVDLVVSYNPKKAGVAKCKLIISAFAANVIRPYILSIDGQASYPKLVVVTKILDFGTALFKNANRRKIEVKNVGAADATVVFECNHPDIKIDSSDESLTVYPNESKEIAIIYTPQAVEKLNAKAFLYSSDNRGETFMLMLKGSVGIPKLTLHPKNSLDLLNFDVVRLNKSATKSFSIMNEGTIMLNFKTKLKQIYVKPIDKDGVDGKNHIGNIDCPLTVQPETGRLAVGETMEISITFLPTMMAEFEYEFILTYEYQELSAIVKGSGGKPFSKILSPFTVFDFELCRIGRTYEKIITMVNEGNLGMKYHVRPQPEKGDWSIYEGEFKENAINDPAIKEAGWKEELEKIGLTISNPDGYSNAKSSFIIKITYSPTQEEVIQRKFRFFQDDRFENFEIRARAALPSIHLKDPKTDMVIKPGKIPEIDIGVHPVRSVFNYTMSLINSGAFGIDYLIQPMSSVEYDVYPLRGYIEPNSSVPVTISFQPSSESKFQTTLKVIWEGEPVTANIIGNGGVGKLEIRFLDEKDASMKTLDFGMVPFNTPAKKRFFVINYGLVGVKAQLQVENEDYSICMVGEPIPLQELEKIKVHAKDTFSTWFGNQKIHLKPSTAVQIGVRFLPRSATTSVGDITIRSDSGSFAVPLKGKGGTMTLSHKGDLDFGDISCNYTYTRKISIFNGGSIPSNLQASWLVVGLSNESEPYMQLGESYTSIDPRSQWTRKVLLEEKPGYTINSKLHAIDYWAMIALMVRNDLARGYGTSSTNASSSVHSTSGAQRLFNPSRRSMANTMSSHFKRRQIFFHLIASTPLSSQSTSLVKPFIRISPPLQHLPSYGEVQFLVELNLGSEDTFLATLVIKPDITNCPKYEIPLTATPKLVNILCDDTRMLNFYRQPLGETEVISRKFTNLGHKDIPFKFHNSNSGLFINPAKGLLKMGQTITVMFSFTPTDESTQSGDVIFDPLFSQPIRFKMFGGGGHAKASLSRYRRFDFGHCMIGKDTVSYLPIVNEGNAILHLTRFELDDTDTFFKGQDWPKGRISLFPGKNYSLPLVFHPQEENPLSGNLIIGTNTETFEIELIGLGREAVLIVSKVALEFSECLMGNTYEQKLGLKNIGDVNYPVTCHLDKEFPDISFHPNSLVISPFSESFVTITYSPSHQTKTTVIFTLASPYSSHKVPIMVHAGIAFLEFNSTEIDFGMFERTTQPTMVLNMKNSGTVKTSFSIKDTTKPSIFTIEPSKGLLLPKKSIDVKITHIKHEVSQFNEKLAIRTDLVDKIYSIYVKGQCEETVLHPQEFSLLNLGVCPVLEPTTKPLQFKNYGKFPLKFSVPSAYPLKVAPTEGIVAGGETGSINLTWNPSGGYELRTQLSITTNIGKFPILVRGKSMFPEVFVSTQYLDFGVCALGYSYHQYFTIENRGKVKLNYTIPSCKETSYVASISSGVLDPKQSITVDLLFTPRQLGKLSGSLLIDCKGIHYKEIILVGMGGTMLTDVSPQTIDLERCPYGLPRFQTVQIVNSGDITLRLDFSKTRKQQGSCEIMVPEPFTIPPKQTGNCVFAFSAFTIERFYAKIVICTVEQTFTIPVTGVGIKINLSQKSKKLLQTEKFRVLSELTPFYAEPEFDPIDFAVCRLQREYQTSIDIYDLFSIIYQQEESKRQIYTDPVQMEFSADKRISFLHDHVNIGMTTKRFRSVVETKEPLLLDVTLEDSIDNLNQDVPDPNRKSVTFAQSPTDSYNPLPDSQEQAEKVYVPPDIERPSSRASNVSTRAQIGDVPFVPLEEELGPIAPSSPRTPTPKSNPRSRSTPKSPKRSAKSPEAPTTAIENQPVLDDPITNLKIPNTNEGLRQILDLLKQNYDPFGEPKMDVIEKIADKFVQVKDRPQEDFLPDQDVCQQVIDFAQLKITQIDLEPILEPQQKFDWIDVGFITQRPPPFQREKEVENLALKTKQSIASRKGYLSHFPKLNRLERNAKSHPFEQSHSTGYGKGVRLYRNNE